MTVESARLIGLAWGRARRRDVGPVSIVVALLIIWTIFQSLNNVFLSPENLFSLSRQISYGGVVSLGLVLVLLIGEVDLSVGSVGGLAAAVLAVLVENHGWNPYLAIAVTVAMGAALGGLQALIFTRFKVPSFVVTLGGLLLFYGLQLRVLGSTGTIRFPFGQAIAQIENKTLGPAVTYPILVIAVLVLAVAQLAGRARYRREQLPASGVIAIVVRLALVAVALVAAVWELNRAGGVPLAFVLLLGLVMLGWLMTSRTRYGLNIYAVGGNAEAARRAGIGVTATRISVFCVCGATAAFGGIMSGSYVGAASQTLGGDTLLLYAIAAAVIGGTSLFGGRGSVWAALLGWLVIGSIYNGMFLLNLDTDIQFMIIGGVLIGAVIVDSVTSRRGQSMTGSREREREPDGLPDLDGLERLVAKLDLAEKVSLLTGADYWTLRAHPGIGLRAIRTSDGPAGVRGPRWDERDTALNVPAPAALAATWDPRRAELIGELLAAECRRKNVDVLLAPTVNLQRTPFGGRNFEFLGEDPLLTAILGAAFVRGLQRGGVAATLKHFVANDSETGRFTVDARIGERELHELYLAPFEAIIRTARPWAVMAAYNAVNGHTMTESPMLRCLLKDEWEFDGLVVSDWHACRSTAAAANAGVDLAMPGPSGPWGAALVQAVREGRVSEASVDDKVLRLLRLATRVGALDGTPADAGSARPWTDASAQEVLRGTAASGFVLARNEPGLLPLDLTGIRRIAVLGPNAAVPRTLGGGSATVFPPYSVSPLDGLRAALPPHVAVVHSPGVRSHTRTPMPRPALLRIAGGDRPGVLVEFIDTAGTVLHREHRMGGFFTWRTFPEAAGKAEVAAVRVTTAIRAESAGRHVIGCSGHGRFRLTLAGTTAFDARLHVPAGTDPTEAYVRPPQRHTPIHLDAGESVEVVLEHYPEGPGTSFTLGGVSFQLNVEEPHAADDEEIARAVRLAREADVAIVVVGTTDEVESEGFDRATLDLPGRQDELVRRVAAVNPRTAVVVNSGAPVLLPWADEVPAVLLTSFPGQEYGNALADVLLGRAEPGGRLPSTWPDTADGLPATTPSAGVLDYTEGLLIGYRLFDRAGREPRYPFGHGLGYTTWHYRGAEAKLSSGGLVVTVRLKNTGTRPGRETVQIYASLPDSLVPRPLRWLAGFGPAEAEPGSEVIARIGIPVRSLAYWDAAIGSWAVEPGHYDLAVGRSSRDIRLTVPVTIAPGVLHDGQW